MISGTEYMMFDGTLLNIFSECQQLTKLDIIREMKERLKGQQYDRWYLMNYVNEKARDGTLIKVAEGEDEFPKYRLFD